MIEETHIHPFIVHFPIAIIVVGAVFKIIASFKSRNDLNEKISIYLLFIGTGTAVLAQLSGMFLTNHPQSGDIYKIFEEHELYALISVVLLIITTLISTFFSIKKINTKSLKIIELTFYLLSLLSILYTGYLGGTMVFDYMIGL